MRSSDRRKRDNACVSVGRGAKDGGGGNVGLDAASLLDFDELMEVAARESGTRTPEEEDEEREVADSGDNERG